VIVVLPAEAGEEQATGVQPAPSAEPEERPFWAEWWERVFGW